MRNHQHGTAFSAEFLDRLQQRDESHTGQEADLAGPWEVEPTSDGYAVTRVKIGDSVALFTNREPALLLAAVLPFVGAEPLWGLKTEAVDGGFPLETRWGDQWVIPAGSLSDFNPELVDALHIADCFVRSPRALALLLEAAGPTALRLAGRYLMAHLEDSDD